jgi:hypothetical protein
VTAQPPWVHSTATPYIVPGQTNPLTGVQQQWPVDGGKLNGTGPAFPDGLPYPLDAQFLHDPIAADAFVEHYNHVLELLGAHTHGDIQARIDKISSELQDYEERIAAQRMQKFCSMSTSVVANTLHGSEYGFSGAQLVQGDPSRPTYPTPCTGSNTIIYVTGSTADLEKPAFCQWDTSSHLFRIAELYVEAVEGRPAARVRPGELPTGHPSGKLSYGITYNVTYITYQKG